MGGFLGIGTSAEAEALQEQQRLKQMEADQARRDAEIALAEKKAKKGQETANIKLGTASKKKETEEEDTLAINRSTSTPSSSLAIGGNKGKTGVQI